MNSLERKNTDLAWLDTFKTKLITCPFCGFEDNDSWEYHDSLSDGKIEIECPECGFDFVCEGEIQILYTTKGKE